MTVLFWRLGAKPCSFPFLAACLFTARLSKPCL